MQKHPDFYVFDALFELLPDGTLLNKLDRGSKTKKGDAVGRVTVHGYREFGFLGKFYKAHRVVWLLSTGQWPAHVVDHIDGDKLNNRIENLRDVPVQHNLQNRRGPQSNSSTRLRGVYPSGNKFIARGRCPSTKKPVHLGTFDTALSAAATFDEYARTNYLGYVNHKEPI